MSNERDPNWAVLAILEELKERQKNRRETDGSKTDELIREARSGAMWGPLTLPDETIFYREVDTPVVLGVTKYKIKWPEATSPCPNHDEVVDFSDCDIYLMSRSKVAADAVERPLAAGDRVRMKATLAWSGTKGMIEVPAGTVITLIPVPPASKAGFVCFEHNEAYNGWLAVDPRDLELCKEDASRPCDCPSSVLFSQGCRCGGV